ncbi:MAG: hypothetical protein EP298_10790 [Gammaproteobacteria bacterium]|nr:MAG: hypothetical protein EP298_10790 [Gammaproteobacteria bacterium]UTW42020.1 hypothetical protein KFE69_10990 [bacterium SCSIO 12844]
MGSGVFYTLGSTAVSASKATFDLVHSILEADNQKAALYLKMYQGTLLKHYDVPPFNAPEADQGQYKFGKKARESSVSMDQVNYVGKVDINYQRALQSAARSLNEYYKLRIEGRVFSGSENDATSGVLNYLNHLLTEVLPYLNGEPKDIEFLEGVENFLTDFSGEIEFGNDRVPFVGVAIENIQKAKQHLQQYNINQSAKDRFGKLSFDSNLMAEATLKLAAMLMTSDDKQPLLASADLGNLSKGLIRQAFVKPTKTFGIQHESEVLGARYISESKKNPYAERFQVIAGFCSQTEIAEIPGFKRDFQERQKTAQEFAEANKSYVADWKLQGGTRRSDIGFCVDGLLDLAGMYKQFSILTHKLSVMADFAGSLKVYNQQELERVYTAYNQLYDNIKKKQKNIDSDAIGELKKYLEANKHVPTNKHISQMLSLFESQRQTINHQYIQIQSIIEDNYADVVKKYFEARRDLDQCITVIARDHSMVELPRSEYKSTYGLISEYIEEIFVSHEFRMLNPEARAITIKQLNESFQGKPYFQCVHNKEDISIRFTLENEHDFDDFKAVFKSFKDNTYNKLMAYVKTIKEKEDKLAVNQRVELFNTKLIDELLLIERSRDLAGESQLSNVIKKDHDIIEARKKDVFGLSHEKAELATKLKETAVELTETKETLDKTKAELEKEKDALEKTQAVLSAVKSQLSAMTSKSQAQDDVIIVQEELVDAKTKVAKVDESLISVQGREISNLEEQVQAQKRKVSLLQEQVNTLSGKGENLEELVQVIGKLTSHKEQELQLSLRQREIQLQVKGAEVTRLGGELVIEKEENESLKKSKTALEKQVDSLGEQIGLQKSQIDVQEKQIDSLNESNQKVQKELAGAKEEISGLKTTLESHFKQMIESLGLMVADCQASISRDTQFLAKIQLESSGIKDRDLDQLFEEIKENFTKRIAFVEQQKEKLEKFISENQEVLKNSGLAIDEANRKIGAADSIIQRQVLEIENLRKICEELKAKLKEKEAESQQLQGTIVDLRSQIEEQSKKHDEQLELLKLTFESQVEKAKEETKRLEKEKEQTEVEKLTETKKRLEADIESKDHDFQRLKDQEKDKDKRISTLENENAEMKAEVEELKKEKQELIEENTKLDQKLSDAKAELQSKNEAVVICQPFTRHLAMGYCG